MPKVSLSSYTLRVKDREEGEFLPLGDVGGEDFQDILHTYLDTRRVAYGHDPEERKVLAVRQLERRDRTLSGIIETGEYGYESPLYDIDQQAISYTRSPREAGMLPFYFVAQLPAQANEGVLLLQRFQQHGIRTILSKDLIHHFVENYPDYSFALNALVAPEVWRAYLTDGRLLSIRFIRFEIPDDLASALDVGGQAENVGYVEYVVHAKRESGLPFTRRIRDFVEGRRQWDSLIELENFEYNTVKVEVALGGGARRTLELTDLTHLRAVYDITEQVEQGEDGHPVYESIDAIAREYLGELIGRMGT